MQLRLGAGEEHRIAAAGTLLFIGRSLLPPRGLGREVSGAMLYLAPSHPHPPGQFQAGPGSLMAQALGFPGLGVLALASQLQGLRRGDQGVVEKWDSPSSQHLCVGGCDLDLELNWLGGLISTTPSRFILALLFLQSGKRGRKQGGKKLDAFFFP